MFTAGVFDFLTSLAECLCGQITADGLPPTCFCGVVPGDALAQNYAGDCATECGMAWVRLASLYPATGVGVASEQLGNCSASIGFEVEIGIMRCVDVGGTDGSPPPPGELLAATELQMADALTMWRAVNCCLSVSGKDYRLGSYAPAGPMGGLVGGTYALTVAL